jgi:prophage regulatory protein
MTSDATDRILRIKTVLELTGLSRSTLYRKVQRGEFPKQIKLSERCAGWRQSSVHAWMRNPMFYSVDEERR